MHQVIDFVAQAYLLVIIAAAIISWISVDPFNPVVRIIRQLTEPVFARIREVVPTFSGIDFSPLIAFIGVHFLRLVLKWLIGA